jgi:hypothetical protein
MYFYIYLLLKKKKQMLTKTGKRSATSEELIDSIESREWGTMILDEVKKILFFIIY